jgi:hypothetical protein
VPPGIDSTANTYINSNSDRDSHGPGYTDSDGYFNSYRHGDADCDGYCYRHVDICGHTNPHPCNNLRPNPGWDGQLVAPGRQCD